MPGYWRQSGETRNVLRKGWLFTGDIGKMDAEGYFTIVDRRKDMILVSGFNVYPNEVEAVLAGLAGVKDCAVIGVPDAATGKPSRHISCAPIRRLTPRRCAISADANSPATKCRDWSSSATICRSRTSARSCARICAKTRPRTPVKGRSEQLGDPAGLCAGSLSLLKNHARCNRLMASALPKVGPAGATQKRFRRTSLRELCVFWISRSCSSRPGLRR